MLSNRKFPRILPENNYLRIFAILFIVAFILFYFFEYYHPPTTGPFYKEYSSVSELQKSAKLGDRVRITLFNPTVNNNGSLEYNAARNDDVIFKLPTNSNNPIKVLPGQNIIYCKINSRLGTTLVCDVEEVKN